MMVMTMMALVINRARNIVLAATTTTVKKNLSSWLGPGVERKTVATVTTRFVSMKKLKKNHARSIVLATTTTTLKKNLLLLLGPAVAKTRMCAVETIVVLVAHHAKQTWHALMVVAAPALVVVVTTTRRRRSSPLIMHATRNKRRTNGTRIAPKRWLFCKRIICFATMTKTTTTTTTTMTAKCPWVARRRSRLAATMRCIVLTAAGVASLFEVVHT
mmetsp:Transcript_10527/g.16061  ORF Transcript_10527/g.16061 Transcript_10527/m.16061 type:complete len:216 (-) Transcript_10527:220-867(-)